LDGTLRPFSCEENKVILGTADTYSVIDPPIPEREVSEDEEKIEGKVELEIRPPNKPFVIASLEELLSHCRYWSAWGITSTRTESEQTDARKKDRGGGGDMIRGSRALEATTSFIYLQ
jgi:hypothetical protein